MDTINVRTKDRERKEAHAHNTSDAGRPPKTADGVRRYRLVLPYDDEPTIKTMCPSCHTTDPGFIDADFPSCPVRCDVCGHETTLAQWMTDPATTIDDAPAIAAYEAHQ